MELATAIICSCVQAEPADIDSFVRDLGLVVTDIEYLPAVPHFTEAPEIQDVTHLL